MVVSFNNCGDGSGFGEPNKHVNIIETPAESREILEVVDPGNPTDPNQSPGVQVPLNISMVPGTLPPQKLSQTGLFVGTPKNLVMRDNAYLYNVNHKLWTDYAKKTRYIILPDNEKIIYSENLWDFPVGTIIIKTFELEIGPANDLLLETRILLRKSRGSTVGSNVEGWEGYSYKWDGDDATLVDDSLGQNSFIVQVAAGALGGARSQNYTIPTRAQCLTCHNSSIGIIRGLRTGQINTMPNAQGIDQLDQFIQQGLFENPFDIPNNKLELQRFVSLDDNTATNEQKVRSYISVHCSHCHNPKPEAPCVQSGDDFKFEFFNPSRYIFADADFGREQRVVPGNAGASSMHNVIDSGQMPQIGNNLKDPNFLPILRNWINNDLQ